MHNMDLGKKLWKYKGLIHAILLDFKKVFDKVPHKKLCDKLAT